MKLLLPSVAIVLIALPAGFWLVFNGRTAAYFVKLFRQNIDELILHEKEYVYVAKSAEEREKSAEAANTWTATFLSIGVLSLLGLAGGVVYATFSDVGYLGGIGTGFVVAGALMNFGARVAMSRVAFENSAIAGIGVFLIELVTFIYGIVNWAETKFPYVSFLFSYVLIFIGSVMMGIGEAMSEAAAAAPPGG